MEWRGLLVLGDAERKKVFRLVIMEKARVIYKVNILLLMNLISILFC